MTSLATLAKAQERAIAACPEEGAHLEEIREMLAGERLLSVGEVAEILGVSSPTTVRNWLESGSFPGTQLTAGGHRRFRLADVLDVRARMELTAYENATGTNTDADSGDEDPYAHRRARRLAKAASRTSDL